MGGWVYMGCWELCCILHGILSGPLGGKICGGVGAFSRAGNGLGFDKMGCKTRCACVVVFSSFSVIEALLFLWWLTSPTGSALACSPTRVLSRYGNGSAT